MTRPAPLIAGIVAALVLLLGAYFGAYYAMLEGYRAKYAIRGPAVPYYRVPWVEHFFEPANRVDRWLRGPG